MKNKYALSALALTLFLAILVQFIVKANADQNSAQIIIPNKLIAQAKKITIDYKLTKMPLACLLFDIAKEKYKGLSVVVVRERHGGICGGDKNTSPRIYNIAIDASSGQVWSDAKSLLGQMKKIVK